LLYAVDIHRAARLKDTS